MKKIVSLCLAAVMTLAAFTLVIPSERAFAANDITADFAKYQNGVVDRKNNAAVSTHFHGGVNCAMVIPKPTASRRLKADKHRLIFVGKSCSERLGNNRSAQ